MLRFVQIDPFPKLWAKLGLTDEDQRRLEQTIMLSPGAAPIVPGSNGLRKLRFRGDGSDRGKRSSYRIFYLYLQDYGQVILWAILDKTDQSDLSQAAIAAFAKQIDVLKRLLEGGQIR